MVIKVLPEEIASQIAAGEVIERPASVVKELLENALDAGAGRIEITIEGAGRKKIVVYDDGSGIQAAELPLAVSRHATSKLSRSEDLFQIKSLGFRGEALASIASVSRLTLSSHAEDADVGARLRVEGGRVGEVEPDGIPRGTTVVVEDLFYNVPARLKFLKSERTERSRIAELVSRYALGYPGIRFQLSQDGRPILQTSGSGDRRQVFSGQYGPDLARQMLFVHADQDEIKIDGLISPTSVSRSNRNELAFFVNGRWVQDPALSAAVLHAYHTLLMAGRYPLASLFIEIPPQMVDVNVHPAKSEVRFRERDRVFSAVQRAVRRALMAYSPVPELAAGDLWRSSNQAATGSRPWRDESPYGPRTDYPEKNQPAEAEPAPTGQKAMASAGLPLLRPIGQVGAAYLIAEGPDGLYLIDQHAAHERVLFEELTGLNAARPDTQSLLTPVRVTLSPSQAELLLEQIAILGELGFDVEEFGPNTFLLRSVPAVLAGMDPEAALRVLVEDFEEDETPLERQIEARIAARICKRAAVKAGQVLNEAEQRALIEGLEACRSPRTCPHGRPTMIHLSVDLLERQFGRRGPR